MRPGESNLFLSKGKGSKEKERRIGFLLGMDLVECVGGRMLRPGKSTDGIPRPPWHGTSMGSFLLYPCGLVGSGGLEVGILVPRTDWGRSRDGNETPLSWTRAGSTLPKRRATVGSFLRSLRFARANESRSSSFDPFPDGIDRDRSDDLFPSRTSPVSQRRRRNSKPGIDPSNAPKRTSVTSASRRVSPVGSSVFCAGSCASKHGTDASAWNRNLRVGCFRILANPCATLVMEADRMQHVVHWNSNVLSRCTTGSIPCEGTIE